MEPNDKRKIVSQKKLEQLKNMREKAAAANRMKKQKRLEAEEEQEKKKVIENIQPVQTKNEVPQEEPEPEPEELQPEELEIVKTSSVKQKKKAPVNNISLYNEEQVKKIVNLALSEKENIEKKKKQKMQEYYEYFLDKQKGKEQKSFIEPEQKITEIEKKKYISLY